MKSHLLPVLLAVALLVAGLAVPAFARANTTEVSATLSLETQFPDPDWVSGPIAHTRGLELTWETDDGLDGTVDVVHNNNLNIQTLQGTGFGSMTITDGDVTWEGRYRGTYTDFLFEKTFVVHGDDGTVMRGTLAVTTFDYVPGSISTMEADLEGVILDTPGR